MIYSIFEQKFLYYLSGEGAPWREEGCLKEGEALIRGFTTLIYCLLLNKISCNISKIEKNGCLLRTISKLGQNYRGQNWKKIVPSDNSVLALGKKTDLVENLSMGKVDPKFLF